MGNEREFDYGLDPDERYEPGDEPDAELFHLSRPHVMTVLGPIRPEDLGVTLSHEHLIAKPLRHLPGGPDPDPDLILDDPHAALAELEDLYAAGGRSVVDATGPNSGRDVVTLHWVAARAPVHVVAVTGIASDAHSRSPLDARSVDEIAATYVAELTVGIDGTRTRAGVILAGTSANRVTPMEEIALRGAARAHRTTGAPIMARGGGATLLEQLAILTDEGVNPVTVICCRLNQRTDERMLRDLLTTGARISIDQFTDDADTSEADRVALIARLAAAGFGRQILVASGHVRRSSLRAYGGEPGLISLVASFPLSLMAAGLDAAAVLKILVDNPASALTITSPAS